MSRRPPALAVLAAVLGLAGCGDGGEAPPAAPAPAPLARPVLQLDTLPGGRPRVPAAALVERAGLPGVFVLDPRGRARFRMVRPGRRFDGQVEILAGLAGHETLVLGDLAPLRDTTPVHPLPGGPAR